MRTYAPYGLSRLTGGWDVGAEHHIEVGDESFLISDRDVDGLKIEVLAAVHAGGAFVALASNGAERIEMLITPSTRVRWQHVVATEDIASPEPADREWADDAGLAEWWL